MKKCPFCSAELLDEAEFCLYCMEQLTEKTVVTGIRRKKHKLLIFISVFTILALLIGACTLGLKLPKNPIDKVGGVSNNSLNNTSSDTNSPITPGTQNNKLPVVDTSSTTQGSNNANYTPQIDNTTSSKPQGLGNVNDTPQGDNTTSSTTQGSNNANDTPQIDNTTSSTPETNTSEDTPIADLSSFEFKENETGYTVYGTANDKIRTEAIIPSAYNGKPVTEIGAEAFFHNKALRAVHIPKTVKKIGDNAFIGCTNLSELEIPEGVEEIGFSAFANIAVEHLVIPSTVKVLTMSFSGDSFKTVTMKCIPDLMYNVFEFCTKLEKVYLPDELKVIESGMFKDCHSLKSVSFVFGLTSIRIESFKNCFGLERIDFDTEILEFAAFENCKNLKTVNFAATMKKIDGYVFSGCVNLTDIIYGGTKADWNKIDKDADWDKNLDTNEIFNNYTIHCSDGDITV